MRFRPIFRSTLSNFKPVYPASIDKRRGRYDRRIRDRRSSFEPNFSALSRRTECIDRRRVRPTERRRS